MACATGTPIRASMSGKVAYVGWSNIFGNYVIINHANGYQTLYGHMSKTLAKKGQVVDLAALTCAFETGHCSETSEEPPLPPCEGDTVINLPLITGALVNDVKGAFKGSANSGIQSNGSASITMGKSSTDGEISFTGLLEEDGYLIFRASPYNSATTMQLDLYVDDELLQSIRDTVKQETRNEVRYTIDIPAGTTKIRFVSVGGSTSSRACMQELYLISCNPHTGIDTPSAVPSARKVMRNGQIIILRNESEYTITGQILH